MSSYYHTHENTTNTTTTTTQQIHDHANLHTLILMNNNPNLAIHNHHHQQLLNSAATFSHPPPSFSNHFNRLPPPDHENITLYGYPQEQAREVSRARQGLSLSLSSQNPAIPQSEISDVAGGGAGQVSVLGSKYLRATQELLEEVVNVGDTSDQSPNKGKGVGDTLSEELDKHGSGGGGGGCGAQLSTAERQEVQMKKAKLVTMLDEAEQRYRQYNNQIQIVIESFERAAGIGSAKTYTALALKTISKQFRCLKDAIQGQIRAANKSLGEDEGGSGLSGGKIEVSKLKFIDHQIRQQRALQQLGMIQNHNAWRPQRGLPERSVSVLRAWLFEHFLHPYPKDSDKILLAKQTGLTRSQVSNWFINARVRLWKPMIEEMYNEELKEQEQNKSEEKASTNENNNSEDIGASNSLNEQEKINTAETRVKASKLLDQHSNAANSSSSFMSIPHNPPGFTINGSLELNGISQGSPKRQRGNEMLDNREILIKFGNDDEKQERNNNNVYPIISGGMDFMSGGELGSYPNMGDLGRFEPEDFPAQRFFQGNGGISLSLGLPPSSENHQQQHFHNLSGTSHTFMSPNENIHQFRRGNDFGSIMMSNNPSSHSSNAGFECIDVQNRKGFAPQLVPDFVA